MQAATAQTARPGERLIAGRAYIYDADLLQEHLDAQAIATAPADMATLSDLALTALIYALRGPLGFDAPKGLGNRALAERDRRAQARRVAA